MKIVFEDTDLEELITTGRNSKYKKYTRNAKFMKAHGFKFRRYALWQQEMRTLHLSWQCILV